MKKTFIIFITVLAFACNKKNGKESISSIEEKQKTENYSKEKPSITIASNITSEKFVPQKIVLTTDKEYNRRMLEAYFGEKVKGKQKEELIESILSKMCTKKIVNENLAMESSADCEEVDVVTSECPGVSGVIFLQAPGFAWNRDICAFDLIENVKTTPIYNCATEFWQAGSNDQYYMAGQAVIHSFGNYPTYCSLSCKD